jgi:hypothetical protein
VEEPDEDAGDRRLRQRRIKTVDPTAGLRSLARA